ncbi:MAG: NAD(P)H-binding protein [Sandaracinaceae bacterium]
MRLVLFGATGMIGQGALIECLEDDGVDEVLAVVRKPTGRTHDKLTELIHEDFLDYATVEDRFAGYDACLYCLGVSAVGMSESDYRRVTYDFTVAAAQALLRHSPGMRMCFISGASTDASSRQMWARVKAEAEQALLAMPWRSAHMFRPGVILPRKGVRSGVPLYRAIYASLGWTYPVLKAIAPSQLMTTVDLGRAMIEVGRHGHEKSILEAPDINAVAAKLG